MAVSANIIVLGKPKLIKKQEEQNMLINRKDYSIELSEPTVYVDNQSRGRSGHMTHALAEFAPGKFIDFNSNCSALRMGGHFPYGWVEYRISEDSGKTYSDIKTLGYSYKSFIDGINSISIEKAVGCDGGTIVAFCLRNDAMKPEFCEPWATPTFIRSCDAGESWSEPEEYSKYPGRTYDAVYHKGSIYVLHFCNPNFLGETDEHKYRIYKSVDSGKTFVEHCTVAMDTKGRSYASMIFDENDVLHVYAYNSLDEVNMDHIISRDFGETWETLKPSYVEKGIRNPQTAIVDGIFIAHGRSGDRGGFVLYSSVNGSDWDEGVFVEHKSFLAGAYYSNNLNLEDENGKFLLIQYSSPYTTGPDPNYVGTVNVKHMRLTIKK